MSLVSDIAASEAADVAEAIRQLRSALVELLNEIAATDDGMGGLDSAAYANGRRIIADLDAGELLWPGWKKGRA